MLNITQIEETIISCLLRREDYIREVSPFLDSKYFESNEGKTIFTMVSTFFEKYNTKPTLDSIMIMLDKASHLRETEYANIKKLVKKIYDMDSPSHDIQWLRDESEQWCQDRAIYLAVVESIGILQGEDGKKKNKHCIPDLMRQALAVSFDRSIGHDYNDDYMERWKFYTTKDNKIAFDLDYFNKITDGGVCRKTLNIIMAGTAGGKSMLMCHLASKYIAQGLNVLYITCEMAEERIAERIDANILGVNINELSDMTHRHYEKIILDAKKKMLGKLIIKEYATATANVNHFRHLIDELQIKQNLKPDVIFIDYLNICASARYRNAGAFNSYTLVKGIAEEIRGLAIEKNVAMWSATQLNREGYGSSDPELIHTADSFGLPAVSDLLFVLVQNEEMDNSNQMMVKQLKNRYNDISYHRRFMVGVDKPKMTFYDIQQNDMALISSEDIVQDNYSMGDTMLTESKMGMFDMT